MVNGVELRTLIKNGWTRSTRKIFERRLGKENFEVMKQVYSEMRKEVPLIPKALAEGGNICLSFNLPAECFETAYSEVPPSIRPIFKKRVQKFLDKMFPKFRNEEIKLENICNKMEHLDLEKLSTEEELLKALGVNFREESYKISDVIKLKRVGNTAKLKRDPSFTTEVISDKKNFQELAKLFGKTEQEFTEIANTLVNPITYAIKNNGQTIGYFSIDVNNGRLCVSNYVLYPQYRHSKTSLNAILTVRDKVIEEANRIGVKTVETGVEANNPRLLGLYKRFGFQPTKRTTFSFPTETGETINGDVYGLIGYLA